MLDPSVLSKTMKAGFSYLIQRDKRNYAARYEEAGAHVVSTRATRYDTEKPSRRNNEFSVRGRPGLKGERNCLSLRTSFR